MRYDFDLIPPFERCLGAAANRIVLYELADSARYLLIGFEIQSSRVIC
jgi:hypothetical protein